MKYLFFLTVIVCLSGCHGKAGLNLGQYSDPTASKDDFLYCYGYGCSQKIRLGFSQHEWKTISKIFRKKSKTAEIERQKIGKAIALMEKYTGALAKTENDLPKAPIFRDTYFELDCIDETVNTTKYLTFLKDADFLKHHDVGKPIYKGMVLNGVYPHNSASIVERETGEIYAVDSYIYKNGAEPNIRGFENWRQYRVEELDKAQRITRP